MMKTFVATAAVAVALAASTASAQTRSDSDSWRGGYGQRYSDDRGGGWGRDDDDGDRRGYHGRMHRERHGQGPHHRGWGDRSMGSMGAMGRYHGNALWCVPVDEDDARWGGGWGGGERGGFWCVTRDDKLGKDQDKGRGRSSDDDDDDDNGDRNRRL